MSIEHDLHGPSSHENIIKCLGFTSSQSESEASAEGTRLHRLCELELKRILLGEIHDLEISESDNEMINDYVETCVSLRNDYPDWEMYIEYAIPLPSIGNKIGTLDFLIVSPFEMAIIVDYKSGRHMKHPACAQMKSYGVGVMREFGVSEVDTIIIQPKAQSDPSLWHHSQASLLKWEAFIKEVIAAAKSPVDKPLSVGPQCSWCSKNGNCIAQSTKLAINWPLVPLSNPDELGPKSIKSYLDRIFTLDDVIKAYTDLAGQIKSRAHTLIESGNTIDGYALEPGRATRVWANEKEAEKLIEELLEQKGKDISEAYEIKTTMLSPAKLEKKVGVAKAIKERIDQFVFKKEGSKSLVKVGK